MESSGGSKYPDKKEEGKYILKRSRQRHQKRKKKRSTQDDITTLNVKVE
jgi:hypothetical protein